MAPIILLHNVVALHKKPHSPAKLISMPEKSFVIGYRRGLLELYGTFELKILGENDFLFFKISP